jgi:aspartyl-tRNA(Asn)/glutamyl-tRNA(Gln) amidotransferase subunit B
MASYRPVIGLEIHVQLNTKTKLFCSCRNEYSPDEPNKNICPFCTGQPGALPVLSKEAVKKAISFGVGIGAKIPEKTRWDRKNYFYPDLPTGYQISQYDNPIVEGGKIEFYIENKENGKFEPSSVILTRAHLEADAAKLLHANGKTFVDFNRSGCPLMEIVTEPVIHSSAEAMAFVSELQLLVRKLGISDGDMDKGQMRFDCNVSLQNPEQEQSGSLPPYRTETKNINSIRSLGRAIEYEIKRQTELLEKGEIPKQETRGWKDESNKSVSQRSKEEAMDYRYFPEPDLNILVISHSDIPSLSDLPQLPSLQRKAYLDQGLNIQLANTFVGNSEAGEFYDKTSILQDKPEMKKLLANIISGPIISLASKLEKSISQIVNPQHVLDLANLFDEDKINNQGIAKALELIAENLELNALEVVEQNGLLQVTDTAFLEEIATQVIAENPSQAEEYRAGKQQVIGFLIGQCMKAAKGQGNPKKFTEILTIKLNS